MKATTMTAATGLSRRNAMMAGAITLAAPFVPKAAKAETETPVMKLFREWCPLWAKSCDMFDAGVSEEVEVEHDRIEARMADLERAMMDAPKAGMMDILVTIAAATNFGVIGYGDEVWEPLQAQARALVGEAA